MPCQIRALSVVTIGIALSTLAAGGVSGLSTEDDGFRWKVHDEDRPKPPVVSIANGVPSDGSCWWGQVLERRPYARETSLAAGLLMMAS